MKYTIDRIENNIAICETPQKTQAFFEIEKLYSSAKEGDIFEFSDGEYTYLPEETKCARNKNIALQNSLFEE